jgi:hypothetical protein
LDGCRVDIGQCKLLAGPVEVLGDLEPYQQTVLPVCHRVSVIWFRIVLRIIVTVLFCLTFPHVWISMNRYFVFCNRFVYRDILVWNLAHLDAIYEVF